jgi:hypothetical protein
MPHIDATALLLSSNNPDRLFVFVHAGAPELPEAALALGMADPKILVRLFGRAH